MNETSRLVREAFALFQSFTFFGLSQSYTRYDQVLMKSGRWDPDNPDLLTNQTKVLLEQIDPASLDASERVWYDEILWFWYHHAVSCVKERARAQAYAAKALELQVADHPNRITRLLWFLAYNKVDEAKKWIDADRDLWDEVELKTARDTVEEYEKGKFWE